MNDRLDWHQIRRQLRTLRSHLNLGFDSGFLEPEFASKSIAALDAMLAIEKDPRERTV